MKPERHQCGPQQALRLERLLDATIEASLTARRSSRDTHLVKQWDGRPHSYGIEVPQWKCWQPLN
jgi:hypothetical protein